MFNFLLAEETTPPAPLSFWENPMSYVAIALIAVMVVLMLLSSRRRKQAHEQVVKMLDELRMGQRVKTVGGIIGRIKEIREEAPGVKTVLLQTGSDKYPAYALFDIQAIYGVIPEEGHNLDGTPVIKTAVEPDNNVAFEPTVTINGEPIPADDFDAKDYVDKSSKAASKRKKS
jgi:preprotein translocase YajC subunit